MYAFRTLKIGSRLTLAFSGILLLLVLLGGFGILQMHEANAYAKDLGGNWTPSLRLLGEIQEAFNDARRASLRHIIETTPAGKQKQRKHYEDILRTRLPKLFSEYEPYMSSVAERQAYEQLRHSWAASSLMDQKQMTLSEGSPAELALAGQIAVGEAAQASSEAHKALSRSMDINVVGATEATEGAERGYERALLVSLSVIAIALLTGGVLAWLVTRSIVQPLRAGVRVAQAVAQGDLTTQFDIQGHDEPADLLRALQHMNERLVDIVGQVRLSSDSIATGSAEIATGNADLSQRTEQQASNLEETAASMEELNSTVKTNADTAQQANRLASEATQSAEQGGAVVGRVVATMQDISASSKKIADIIGVIDGIAFQTNILALNAAVEAARAGEQGRGFAVVASEVRGLAGRSAEAAKQIKGLIGASVEKVQAGASLVDEAGQSMEGIVTQVRRVSALINEISSATLEQSSGISQIGDAVNQLDQVTQQNAALVEESAAAADSLKHQSQRLAELVSVFKINDQPSSVGQSSPAALSSRQFAQAPAFAPLPKASVPRKPSLAKARSPALSSPPKALANAGGNGDWESF